MNINNKFKDKLFHNTELLLKNYRDVVWSLEVAVHQINKNFYIEYGCEIDEFLDMAYDAGMELKGTYVESHTKSIEKSRNILKIIDNAVDLLRKKHKNGEIYYWILYYTYLSPQELSNTDEVIEKLTNYLNDISRSTYFRKKNEAILQLGRLLWGYTSRECFKVIEKI